MWRRAAVARLGTRCLSSKDWKPSAYLQFESERTRPARDLLAQVPGGVERRRVVDVGCGPGNSTELLVEKYSRADVLGIDSSPAMLEAAQKRLPSARFAAGDANTWIPTSTGQGPVDLVFSNATYHWIPAHMAQFKKIMAALQPGAVLAVQMADNLAEPSHTCMITCAKAGPWAARLAGAAREPLAPAGSYYDALSPLASKLHIWRTTYLHKLAGAAGVVDLFATTGLKPFLDPLSAQERDEFISKYIALIAKSYPPLKDGGILLPFPRLFIVAER